MKTLVCLFLIFGFSIVHAETVKAKKEDKRSPSASGELRTAQFSDGSKIEIVYVGVSAIQITGKDGRVCYGISNGSSGGTSITCPN